MKKLLRSIICIILLHLFFFEGHLDANTFFLGGIDTVYPDGAINALKNPALVAVQKESTSTGFITDYTVYYDENTDMDLDSSDINDFDQKNSFEKQRIGGIIFGYTHKSNRIGYGIGISNSEDSLYSYKKSKSVATGTALKPTPISFTNKRTSEETQINPVISFSLGWVIGKGSSVGIRLLGGYSRIKKKDETDQSANSDDSYKEKTELKELFSTGVQFGFFFEEGSSQVGFLIKSPRFDLFRSELDYHYEDPANEVNGTTKIDSYYRMGEGAAFVIGGYTRILPKLGIVLEGEYKLPTYYTEKNYSGDDLTHTYITHESSISINSGIWIKGGIEFLISPVVKFDLGGGVAFITSTADDSKNTRSAGDYTVFYGSAGMVISLGTGVTLLTGLIINRLNADLKSNTSDGINYQNFKMKTARIKADAFLGLMKNF